MTQLTEVPQPAQKDPQLPALPDLSHLTDVIVPGIALSEFNYRPDARRVFYHATGHFHGDYSAVDIDFERRIVTVSWMGGLTRELTGSDAYRFLKLNRSRHALLFDDKNKSKPKNKALN